MIAKRSATDTVGTRDTRAAWADAPRPADRLISGDAAESPARTLQQTLASRISDDFALNADDSAKRWPRRQRLIFLICAATALWGVTIGLAMVGAEIAGYLRG